MSLTCDYHKQQGEALGYALGLGRLTKDEASAEQRELGKEIADCKECLQ